MHFEAVAAGPVTETSEADGVPKGRSCQKLAPVAVGDGQVVDGLDLGSAAHVLDGGDEALCARVEQVTGLGPVGSIAPFLHFAMLLRCEARGLAEGDEPGWESVAGDAGEDTIEFMLVLLPCRGCQHCSHPRPQPPPPPGMHMEREREGRGMVYVGKFLCIGSY